MFCGNCGATIAEGTAVCPVCGAVVPGGGQTAGDAGYMSYDRQEPEPGPAFEPQWNGFGREERPDPLYEDGRPLDDAFAPEDRWNGPGAEQPDHSRRPLDDAFAPEPAGAPLRGSGFAVAALVLAFLSALTCIIPFVSLPLALIGLIFSIFGLRSEQRSMSKVAMVLSILFLIWNIGVVIVAVVFMKKYGFSLDHIRYFITNYFKNFFR